MHTLDNVNSRLNRDLGVKGFCFRGYKDNATVAAKVRECGLDRIDLSRPQLDFKDAALHEPALRAYADAGITIVGIGVVLFAGDEAGERQYFEFCRKAGCSTIATHLEPGNWKEFLAFAEKLAEQYDCRIAIHNHGGKHWLGNSQMLEQLLRNAGPRVGLCVDTGWCIQAGEDPVRWLERFGDRVYGVHYKDFTFDPHGRPSDVIVGTGALDLPAFVRGLKQIGFNGPAVIEYEGDVENPVPALKACVDQMRPVLLERQQPER